MNILLAVDGSDDARRAVDFVARAGWLRAANELTVFTVLAPLGRHASAHADPDLVRSDQGLAAEEILQPVRERLRSTGMVVHCDWAVGPAPDAIVRKAAQGCFELVVMGCRGRGSLVNLVTGSTTNGVLAGCRVPVLVIR